MTGLILFSDDTSPFSWSEAEGQRHVFGTKGAFLAALPRVWTPPFALIAASVVSEQAAGGRNSLSLGRKTLSRLRGLAGGTGELIIRSSVVGESIWERGTYLSLCVSADAKQFRDRLCETIAKVAAKAPREKVGLVIQRHVPPVYRGEFANLLRVSKTRDHWELSFESSDGAIRHTRINTQRDQAADPTSSLIIRPGRSRERLFGSVAAWLNNELLRGRPDRLTCEWIIDDMQLYLVQVDKEDEDVSGINPFQTRVQPAHYPQSAKGSFLTYADVEAINTWDKLKILDELWEPTATHRPTLFYVTLSEIPDHGNLNATKNLCEDFRSLIGNDGIIVRTSVRAGKEKLPNLPRTECLSPDAATEWCLAKRDEIVTQGGKLEDYAFVAHRFIASRASAWVRAEPDNAMVEIHALWGLPDALQYFPYDIWEVHLPTETATDYPDYKSNMLIPRTDGSWEYARVKNDLARHLCIGEREALELANRTMAIAQRFEHGCHVMWFVGCVDHEGEHFNLPWYWTSAHDIERNIDRFDYRIITISDRASLERFKTSSEPKARQAVELKVTDLDLMRDPTFIKAVAETAAEVGVPVILAGSTLAHAYYQLRAEGCAVVARGIKDHSRVRRNTVLGKLVRDKIPARIAQRKEQELTREMPDSLVKGFLISKLLEEALEVRKATTPEQKKMELADLYEVWRALASGEGIPLDQVVKAADEKRAKVGGFERGLVLMQTGIRGDLRLTTQETGSSSAQVFARKTSSDTYEVPFTLFGFMEFDQVRTLKFEDVGVKLNITLKGDRIVLNVSKSAEQLELPLDLTLTPDD